MTTVTTRFIENLDEIEAALDPLRVLELIGYSDKTPHISGNEIRCPCPVHKGDGLNLAINTEKHSWFCHSRNCKGKGLIDLYAQANGVKYRDAAEQLAGRFGIPVQYKQIEGERGMSQKKKYSVQGVVDSWEGAKEDGPDVYFSKKGLSPPPGVRFGKNVYGYPALLVPLKDIEGQLKGVISIGESKNGETKRFQFTIDNLDGAFFSFGSFEGASEVIVGEGVATVQTAWKLLGNQIPAASAGTWSNIPKVVRELKKKHPSIKPIILIDVDEGGKGAQAAATVAKEFSDASFRMPCFENCDPDKWKKGEPPTDFNDLMQLAGENETIRQLKAHHPREELRVPDNDYTSRLEAIDERDDTSHQDDKNNATKAKETVKKKEKYLSVADALDKENFFKTIEEKRRRFSETGKIELSGIPTGYQQLDEVLDGLQAGNLITIAGRTGMGKTFLALNFVDQIATLSKIPVSIFSLEMSQKQLLFRLISLKSGVSALKIKRGTLGDDEMEKVRVAVDMVKELPIYIADDSSNSNLKTLLSNAKSMHEEGRAQVLFVDHIGLMKAGNDYGNKTYEVGEITRELKLLAVRFQIPIIALAQLNREADKPSPPTLSTLKDSGNIEQDSDSVIFIHRRDYYDKIDKPGQAQVIVAKNRHGDSKEVTFEYDKESWKLKESSPIQPTAKENTANKNSDAPKGHKYT